MPEHRLPVQRAADPRPADLAEVSRRQGNHVTLLVAHHDALAAAQAAAVRTFRCGAALEAVEEKPLGLQHHGAAEPHVPHTGAVLLAVNESVGKDETVNICPTATAVTTLPVRPLTSPPPSGAKLSSGRSCPPRWRPPGSTAAASGRSTTGAEASGDPSAAPGSRARRPRGRPRSRHPAT